MSRQMLQTYLESHTVIMDFPRISCLFYICSNLQPVVRTFVSVSNGTAN